MVDGSRASGRARAELALRPSEEKFALAFYGNPDAVSISRLADGVFLDVNEAFCRLTGHGPEEILGHTPLPDQLGIWVTVADRARFLDRLRRDGRIQGESFSFRRKSGEAYTGLVSASLLEVHGEACVLTTTRDITAALSQTLQLERLTLLYAALRKVNQVIVTSQTREALLDGICRVLVTDGPFTLTWVGWDDPETHEVRILSHHGDDTGYLDGFQVRSDDTPLGRGGTGTAIREQRNFITNDLLASPAYAPWREAAARCGLASSACIPIRQGDDVQGALVVYAREIGFFGPQEVELLEEAARDIAFALDNLATASARQRSEQALRDSEAQLRQLQKMESLGTLAGGIAHDFNNILSAILGAAEIVHMHMPGGDPARPALEIIFQAGQRAAELNKQILTFSRKGRDEQVPFDLSALVKEATRLLKATLPKNVRLPAEVTPSIWVTGNANQIHQVFLNLAINAFHALGPEGGDLGIDLAQTVLEPSEATEALGLEPGRYAVLTVQDSGCGMAPEVLAQIFEPFYTTKAVREGTGLGLAVVAGILCNHKGTIRVTSEPGVGSQFRIHLPSADPQALAQIAPQAEDLAGGERILLVDDEDLVTAVLKEGLLALGYRVTAKTSGRDALEAFQADPYAFDLLVTDQAMPDLAGDVLTQAIQTFRPDLPAILITGNFNHEEARLSRSVHYDAVLVKPQGPRDLARAIRQVLGLRRPEPLVHAGDAAPWRKPLILVAEDNAETRTMITAVLVKGGCEVLAAADGQEALDHYLAAGDPRRFSLLITDLGMPRMDGLELLSRLRQIDPALPAMVLSSMDDPESVKSALDLRVIEFLGKPIDPLKLLETVSRHAARAAWNS